MSNTGIKSEQIKDEQVKRADLNSTTSGSAVIKKIIAGNNLTATSTGADAGTGDVTLDILKTNNTFLTGRNQADTSYIGLLKIDGSDNTILNTASGKDISFQDNSTETWRIVSGGNLRFNQSAKIRASTSDASDTFALEIGAGGDANLTGTRGASIRMFGNEHASTGTLQLIAGNVSGSVLSLITQGSGQNIQFITGGSTNWEVIQSTGGLRFTSSAGQLYSNTSDGSDNVSLFLSGGGAVNDATRGAFLNLNGNEAGNTGIVSLSAGNVSGGVVQINAPHSAGIIKLSTAGTERWDVNASGHLTPFADATYDFGTSSLGIRGFFMSTGTAIASGRGSIQISGDNLREGIELNSSQVCQIQGNAFGGTVASPSATPADKALLQIQGSGYSTSLLNTVNKVQIALKSGGTWSGTSTPTYISFFTTPVSSTTPAEVWRIDTDGQLVAKQTATNSNVIRAATSDGSDSTGVHISGGGAYANDGSRGAMVRVYGNEQSAAEGMLILQGGNTTSGQAGEVRLNSISTSGKVSFYTANTLAAQFNNSQNFLFENTTFYIAANSSDASDTKSLMLCGGGSNSAGRGAYLRVFGNDAGGGGSGYLELNSGDGSNGSVAIYARQSGGIIQFATGGSTIRYAMDDTKLYPNADNTYDLGGSSNNYRNVYTKGIVGLTGTSWTPTLSTASGTYTSTTINYAKYDTYGKWVVVTISFTGTTSTTTSYIQFTLPIAAANIGSNQVAHCLAIDTGNSPGYLVLSNNSTTCQAFRFDNSNFTAGSGRSIFATFTYLGT